MNKRQQENLLNFRDVAAQLGVSVRTVERLCSRRQLAFYRIGRNVKFSQRLIDEYLERRALCRRLTA
jgi:excisionase family DNA binding protein